MKFLQVSFCREFQTRKHCPRGVNCSFAHSEEELERYRAKYKKNSARSMANQSNHAKENATSTTTSGGSNTGTNFVHYANNPPNDRNVINKTIIHSNASPYRSEMSLNSASNNMQQAPHTVNKHHQLRPSNAYNANNSSVSTPNLSKMQLSPSPQMPKSSSPQINSRFPFNNNMRPIKVDSVPTKYPNYQPNFNQNYVTLMDSCNKTIPPYYGIPSDQSRVPGSQILAPMNGNTYYPQKSLNSPTPQFYRNEFMTNENVFLPWCQQSPCSPNNAYGQIPPAPQSQKVDEFLNSLDVVDGNMLKSNYASQTSSYLFPSTSKPQGSGRDKFIRSDSILATSMNDESCENVAHGGKYGAIGGMNKAPDASTMQGQWNKLQKMPPNKYIMTGAGNDFDVNGLKSINAEKNLNDSAHPLQPSYGEVNRNILMNVSSNFF